MKEETYFINDLLDIGEYMMSSGAEIYRIEDTLSRMGLAYGAARKCICYHIQHCCYSYNARSEHVHTNPADSFFRKYKF